MHEIRQIRSFDSQSFICGRCEKSFESSQVRSVDGDAICDDCFDDEYGDLVKCNTVDCHTHLEEENLTNGMCESCYEVNSPPVDSDEDDESHSF